MTRRIAAWCGVAVLVAATVLLIGWRVHGGRWVRVETASMGTEAPVGTLLWVAPVPFDTLRPGDLITFRPPGSGHTFSHLVKTVHADGTLTTQGRITSPDPWRIGAEDVVGRVVMRWQGVGWLLVAAPVLLIGGLVVATVSGRLRDRETRVPVTVIGVAVVLSVALSVYRPLTRAEQLSFAPVDGGARATYVSTGLLPMRLSAHGADPVVLGPGEVGSVVAGRQSVADDRLVVAVDPAVPRSWWGLLVGLCLVPALIGSVVRRRRGTATENAAAAAVAAPA